MSPVQRRPDGLGDFLKARRAQLTPHEVGLPEAGAHRKVAGLRREEVAQLAAISVDYLTRLEQRLCVLASWNAELACGVPPLPVPGEAL
jgi:hypothetical protein